VHRREQTFKKLTERVPTWEELQDYYQRKRHVCSNGKRGKIYSLRKDKLTNNICNNITCAKCRPGIKRQLHQDIVRQVYQNDLDQHFVITSPGKKFRKKHNYADSFKIQEHEWNKYRFVIQYHYPDFKFIRLPRAQTNPTADNPIGYAHQHIIANRPNRVIHKYKDDKIIKTIPTDETLSFDWLTENKERYQLGFVWIRENQSVADYLHKDFYHDDEWVIPTNKNHVSTSRDIILRPYGNFIKDPDSIYFTEHADKQTIENTVMDRYGRTLPFEEYLKQYHDIYKEK